MNETSVKAPALLENGTVEQTVPSSVAYRTASENEADAVFSEIQTGMGDEMDDFLKNGDTGAPRLYNKITDRRKTAACPEFYVWNRQTYGKPSRVSSASGQ